MVPAYLANSFTRQCWAGGDLQSRQLIGIDWADAPLAGRAAADSAPSRAVAAQPAAALGDLSTPALPAEASPESCAVPWDRVPDGATSRSGLYRKSRCSWACAPLSARPAAAPKVRFFRWLGHFAIPPPAGATEDISQIRLRFHNRMKSTRWTMTEIHAASRRRERDRSSCNWMSR